MSTPHPWNYFVSYAYGRGFGNCDIRVPEKITSYEPLNGIREAVASSNGLAPDDVIILNFVLLSGPEQQASPATATYPAKEI